MPEPNSLAARPNGARPFPGPTVDAVIVGAGLAGMYMLYRLRGMDLEVRVFDVADGVGGTWYWNRYPGARCDIESMQYSYQFSDELQQEWEWTERYATQPEILAYANHVADRFDLRRDIQFETTVESATFDAERQGWIVETDDGQRTWARYCIMATGCLSTTNLPDIEGVYAYAGETFHTGRWPHEPVDFTGKRVGVIGTGSSAIQSIPLIAEQASHLYVFQRTAHYTVPAQNHVLDPAWQREFKASYAAMRERARQTYAGVDLRVNPAAALESTDDARNREYERRWREGGVPFMAAFSDLLTEQAANDSAAEFVRNKIRETVDDREVAERLCPEIIIGCKRLCVDIGYYETYNRPNVTLVDISGAPIESFDERGLRASGRHYALDAVVFATGFDAMTGTLRRIDIRGREGQRLSDKWRYGPQTYLGLGSAGFPNLFTITGPGSPSVLTNMLPSIEQHVEWIAECIGHMRANGIALIDPLPEAEMDWVAHVGEVAGKSLRSVCGSWYVGANVPGKPRVFSPYIGGVPAYTRKLAEVSENGYEGFALTPPA